MGEQCAISADEPEGVKPQVNTGTSHQKACFQQNGMDGDG